MKTHRNGLLEAYKHLCTERQSIANQQHFQHYLGSIFRLCRCPYYKTGIIIMIISYGSNVTTSNT